MIPLKDRNPTRRFAIVTLGIIAACVGVTPSGDKIGFTVLSSKDGSLYYSNNWVYNTAVAGWSTVEEDVPSPYNAVVIN